MRDHSIIQVRLGKTRKIMHSTTSCDCNGNNCRSQVVMPESPESPEPQKIHEEFPCYTQSFLEEENDNAMDAYSIPGSYSEHGSPTVPDSYYDRGSPTYSDSGYNAMDVGDVTNSKEAAAPTLEVVKPEKKARKRVGSYSVPGSYSDYTDSDSGYSSTTDLDGGLANGKDSDELISEDPAPSLEDDKPKKKDRKRPAGCVLSDDKYSREISDSDSDDENSHSLPCKVEVDNEIERKKRELAAVDDDEIERKKMELAADDRYHSFAEKFGMEKKNCNLIIAEFYINEIQKLSGVV